MHALAKNWTLVRVIRLVLACAFLAAGIANGDTIAFVAAAILGVQAIFNVGCAGNSCAAAQIENRAVSGADKKIIYEEVT